MNWKITGVLILTLLLMLVFVTWQHEMVHVAINKTFGDGESIIIFDLTKTKTEFHGTIQQEFVSDWALAHSINEVISYNLVPMLGFISLQLCFIIGLLIKGVKKK